MTALIFVLLSFLLLPSTQDSANISPEAEAVLQRFVRAKGGEAKLKTITSYSIKGRVLVNSKPVGSFEIYQAANRHRSIDQLSDGRSRQHGTDGQIAWQMDLDGTPSILEGQQARDYLRHHETLHESLEWKRQYHSILYAGKKTIENAQLHHLIFIAEDNRQISRYFSVETGLLVREEAVLETEKNSILQISEIGDYVPEANGTLVSRSRVNHLESDKIEFIVEETETNSVPMETFQLPEPVAKLKKQREAAQ